MKLVKVFAIGILAFGVIAILIWQFWLKGQLTEGQIATAYSSKMVCSCRFVAEREMDSCLTDFTADLGAVRFTEDGDTITASVAGGMVSSTARFDPGLGCTLVEED